jgi:hypothetical protein
MASYDDTSYDTQSSSVYSFFFDNSLAPAVWRGVISVKVQITRVVRTILKLA